MTGLLVVPPGCQAPPALPEDQETSTGVNPGTDGTTEPDPAWPGNTESPFTEGDPRGNYRIVARIAEYNRWNFTIERADGAPLESYRFIWDFGTDDELTYEGTEHTYAFPRSGTFVVTATALDANDAICFILSIRLDVSVGNRLPLAKAGTDRFVVAGDWVCLDASASSDPEDDVLAYEWWQCGGPTVMLSVDTDDPAVACFTAPQVEEAEELRFCLEVDDGIDTDEDSVAIIVQNLSLGAGGGNASAGPDLHVYSGDMVTLEGNVEIEVEEGVEVSWLWTQKAGIPVQLSANDQPVVTFIAPQVTGQDEVLVFGLSVTGEGFSAWDEVTVTVSPAAASGSAAYSEDFNSYAAGTDPGDWKDTGAGNSLAEDDSLFVVMSLAQETVLGTDSALTNIHSHAVRPGSAGWSSYTFTGRMMISHPDGGIGVTFLSSYPNADSYYRLRRGSFPGGASFHIAPHGTSISGGTTNTGAVPAANQWYRFEIEVEDTGSQTEIRAKVWADGTAEPGGWQVDCYDSSVSRLTYGTIGVWGMGPGEKYADDLEVNGGNCETDSDGDGTVDCVDGCQNDPAKTAPGKCGCGVAETDSDGDGTPDCNDQCPGAPDTDSDGDGTADCIDDCPDDPNKTELGQCGCGTADTDSDGDGTPDCNEPPQLCASTDTLNFGTASTEMTFEVWNCGTGSIDYTVTDDADWLTMSPTGGDSSGEHDTVTATIDRTGLPDDTYEAEITVTPSTGSALTILVTMTVGAAGSLPEPVISASRTQGYSPFAVFFEGTASQDANGHSIDNAGQTGTELVEYTWTIKRRLADETYVVEATFSGYNAAHVFEPPGPAGPNGEPSGTGGTYSVTLTVSDRDGHVASATQPITVLPFTGTTYYVRPDGDDGHSGTGPSADQAWRTYAKAFSAAGSPMQPGDRVLFKRNNTFYYTTPVSFGSSAINVLIGAYGSGTRPVIQFNGSTQGNPSSGAPIKSNGSAGVSIADLHFKATSGSDRANGLGTWNTHNLLILRTAISDYDDCISYADGLFIADSSLSNGLGVNLFYNGSRLAIINTEIGPTANSHNLYGDVVNRGVIRNSNFHNPGSTRHNLRIGANHATSRNVLVVDNVFDGGGTWLAIHLAASSGSWDASQHAENILFARNTVRNAGTLIQQQGDYRDTVIRNNDLPGGFALRISPHNDIPTEWNGPRKLWFNGNTITNDGQGWFADISPSSQDVYVWDNTVNGVPIAGTPPPGQ